jgi:protease-4
MKLPAAIQPLLRKTPLPGGEPDRYLLELDVSRGAAEAPPSNPVQALRAMHTPQLRTLVEHLRKAATDDSVVGLIGQLGPSPLTLAQAGELRDAVRRFAESRKPTVAFSPSFGEVASGTISYFLGSGFEEIWLQPTGAVGLVGFAGEAMTVRGTLDLIEAEPEFGQRHEYKTAANTMTSTEITGPHREMSLRLLESANEIVIAAVAQARRLTAERVRELMGSGPQEGAAALSAGLVDRLGYRDEAYAALRDRIGADAELRYVDRWRTSPFENLFGGAVGRPSRKPVVAVVTAHGPIQLGRAESRSPVSGPVVGADTLAAALRAAGTTDRVRAVVLRVDSPGGSYVASDQIRREVLALRDAGIPVVASMGSVAASGGYFIAMPANRVVANPGTITGSIGVLAGKISTRGTTARLGITRETLETTPYSAMFSSNRGFDERERALLDTWLDHVYADFTGKAAHDRGLPLEELEPLARGRVWTGADARERGLVDRLGGLDAAIDEVCELAGLERGQVAVRAMPKTSPLQLLNPPKSSEAVEATLGASTSTAWAALLEGPPAWRQALRTLQVLVGDSQMGVLSLPPLWLPGLLPA